MCVQDKNFNINIDSHNDLKILNTQINVYIDLIRKELHK